MSSTDILNLQSILDFIRSEYSGRDFIGLHEPLLDESDEEADARVRAELFDAETGRLSIRRVAKYHVEERYAAKSLRCRGCVHDATCAGLHINQVRAHGYLWLSPITT